MQLFIVLLVLSAILGPGALSANILAVFHVPMPSHQIIGASLLKGLAQKGHNVTMISPYPLKEKVANYRDIPLDELRVIEAESRKLFLGAHNLNTFQMLKIVVTYTNIISEATLRSPGVQELLKSDEHFDLIFTEMFGNEALFGFGNRFQAPIIVVSTVVNQYTNHLTGNLSPASYVPHALTHYFDKMTFIERYLNICAGIYFHLLQRYIVNPMQKHLYNKYFGDGPTFEDISKNVSLALINSNFCFETPRPYLPNMIPIGGIHVTEPKPLPTELKKFMDEATDGVVFFSLGTNLYSKYLPIEKRKMILNAFTKLPQRVIWKFEDDDLAGKPPNVLIGKRFPQNDILAHPNVKLFITHGGLLSATEALYRGVPMLGVPFYGDQISNADHFQRSGYGLKLQFDDLTADAFLEKMQEILNNPKYRDNIKRSSDIIKDQPMKPLDRAIYWTEYVIRHKGATHLRASAIDLSLIEYFLIDVIIFTIVVLATFIIGIILVFKRLLGGDKTKNTRDLRPKKIKSKLT